MTRPKHFFKEYERWIASSPTCACGCGKSIATDYETFKKFMLRSKKPPTYYGLHRKRGKTKKEYKYEAMYNEWLATKPVCACGCGKPLQTKYSVFATTVIKQEPLPRFIKGHVVGRKKAIVQAKHANDKIVSFKGCKIALTQKEGRCKDYIDCNDRLDCLEFVVLKNKGYGWRRLNG